MPGVLCNGVGTDQPYVKDAHAYCEGQIYRRGGTRAERPSTDNPHSQTGNPVAYADWNRGWQKVDDANGTTLTRADVGCCDGAGIAIAVEL